MSFANPNGDEIYAVVNNIVLKCFTMDNTIWNLSLHAKIGAWPAIHMEVALVRDPIPLFWTIRDVVKIPE